MSSQILISSKSLLSSIAMTFAQKLSGKNLKNFLTTLASSIFSPRLSLAITISLSFPQNELKVSSSIELFKFGGKHLEFCVLDFLGTFIGSLKNRPSFLGCLYMRYPVKFISGHTTKYSVNSFTVCISQSKSCLVPLGLGYRGFNTPILDGVSYRLIYSTQESPHTDLPKCIVAPIKEQ